jgi:hypothetical protein
MCALFHSVDLFTGTAGDSPTSSKKFTPLNLNPGDVAFNEGGRVARDPSEEVELQKDPPLRENSRVATIADSFSHGLFK